MIAALGLQLLLMSVPAAPDGGELYRTHCAACHGEHEWGSADGPSLRGVGSAALDFYLMSGRMPAALPWVQSGDRDERAGQRLSLAEIRALESYLAAAVAGGPAIPLVIGNGDNERGRAAFALNCEHCHGVHADGGSVGGLDWAPALHHVSIDVVADAIRVGPGEMPRFGEQQLSAAGLNDVASYVMRLDAPDEPGGPPFCSTGPVPEGAVGFLAIVVLVAFVFTFWRSDRGRQG